MNKTKYLKGQCQHCDGRVEFPAEAIGMSVECPHCAATTELLLARPPEEPTVPRRTVVWTGITVLILLLGLAGAILALKRAQSSAARKQAAASATTDAQVSPPAESQPEPSASATPSLQVSGIKLQKATGTSLIYAVGTVTNASDRQHFGIKVYVDLLDESGKKIGEATDYQQVLEPKAQWNFKALAVEPKTAGARLAAIKEEP